MARRGNTNIDMMRDESPSAVQSNFIAGLKTEFTGLNFPQNAATETNNCIFTMTGDITRRLGFDLESNFTTVTIDRANKAISSYRWLNAGGDGDTQLLVEQVGSTLYFYKSSAATVAAPLSTQKLVDTVLLTSYLAAGSANDPSTVECQYADGNGYLFIYHPYCDPIYCSFLSNAVTANKINIQIRDFTGIPEAGLPVNFRPTVLNTEHQYNLQNQGWTGAPLWSTSSFSPVYETFSNGIRTPLGSHVWTVNNSLVGVTAGTQVNLVWNAVCTFFHPADGQNHISTLTGSATGTVVSYAGNQLTLTIGTSNAGQYVNPDVFQFVNSGPTYSITVSNVISTVTNWQQAIGNYPSNADVWWAYKDSTNAFNPAVEVNNVIPATAPAPKGHYLLDAFNQDRTAASGLVSITPVTASLRPRTGAWFQGRVWYTGVDASQAPTGDQGYYTWTESIYFSQIVTDTTAFGKCYQDDDPTDQNLFNELPSDGGIIQIQGAGSIHKLYPIQNGMLVIAANGIWFITGSQGIGFSANDYTITKISAIRGLSAHGFLDIQGVPLFWNEEGIYTITPAQQGLGLVVTPVTVGTIKKFYNSIPLDSKRFVKCAYDPVNYIAQWLYRSTQESSVTDRYQYDSILCFNTHTQAFYTYSLIGPPYVHDVIYMSNPGGSSAPPPVFKYITSYTSGSTVFTFSEERDTNHVDWASYTTGGVAYDSHFITGYSLFGQGIRFFQPEYVYVYVRNTESNAYSIQGQWNYAGTGNSGKFSVPQIARNTLPYFNMTHRRHRIRGHGTSIQLKFSSVDNLPMDLMGWMIYVTEAGSI